jgi:hypothetical protein
VPPPLLALLWLFLLGRRLFGRLGRWLGRFRRWLGRFRRWLGRFRRWLGGFCRWLGRFCRWLGRFCRWLGRFGRWLGRFGRWLGRFGRWLGCRLLDLRLQGLRRLFKDMLCIIRGLLNRRKAAFRRFQGFRHMPNREPGTAALR